MKKQPRDYQVNAATALWNHVHLQPERRPLVVMPTGSGKSLTMAMFITGIISAYPHVRIASVVHREELVKSNAAAITDMMPQVPLGVYASGMGRREIRQITVAMIDSVAKRATAFGRIDFLLVDEAHRISDKETTTYQKFISALREKNPNLVVIGFTATDWRMGSGKLTDSGIFDDVCYDLSSGEAFIWMLEQGYLVRPVPKSTAVQVDEHDISIKMGEYDATQSAFEFSKILEPAVDEIIIKGHDRQAWLTFAQSIDHAELIADMMNFKGIPTVAVHSKMKGSREDALAKHRRGEYRSIVNKDILTTGYDDPRIDLIAMLRLTNSVGLWVQMLGRGTRPLWADHGNFDITTREGRLASIAASPKQNCLVLDFAGNTTRLGPINYPNIPKKRKGAGGDPPVRECPECGEYVHISIRECPGCGYVFPEKPKWTPGASETVLVEDRTKPKEKEYAIFGVGQMVFSRHQARDPSKPVSMKVDYFCGVRRFSSWVCPEHAHPFAKKRAADWWKAHQHITDKSPVPETVDAMMQKTSDLRKPKFIKVWINTKYPEIEDYDFRGTRFELPPEFGGPPLQEPTEALAAAAAMKHAEEQEAKDNEMARVLAKEMFDDDIPF